MKKIRDFKLSTKQLIGFGVILILMGAANIFSIHSMRDLKFGFDRVTANWLPRAVAVTNINLNTSELRRSQLQYIMLNDAHSRHVQTEELISFIDKINENIDAYLALRDQAAEMGIYSEKEKELYDRFNDQWVEYQDLSFNFFRLVHSGNSDEAVALINGPLKDAYIECSSVLQNLVSLYQKEVGQAAENAAKSFLAVRGVTITLLITTMLLSLVFAVGLVRWTVVPVHYLEKAARSVADGNLDVQLKVSSKDEIGNLSQSFNIMTRALKAARDKTEEQAERLRLQWEVLRDTNNELEEKSKRLQQKNKELKEAMNTLKAMQAQLVDKEKMASLGQLTAGIAHEINNPINFVSSGVSPLKRDFQELKELLNRYARLHTIKAVPEELEKIRAFRRRIDADFLMEEIDSLLNGIAEGADRTKEIVSGLRSFSRLDENVIKSVDLHEGIDNTLMLLWHKIKHRIEVKKEYGYLPQVECHPGKINQVFLNLLNNAVQAIENEGKIVIRTGMEDNTVCVSISDDGRGIGPEIINKIFDPFFTTKEVGEGTGLGLSISYGIIQKHHGSLTVESEPGKGSTFTIRLPLKQNSE